VASTGDFVFDEAKEKVVSLCTTQPVGVMVVSNAPAEEALWSEIFQHEVTNPGYRRLDVDVEMEPRGDDLVNLNFGDVQWHAVGSGDVWRGLVVFAKNPFVPLTFHSLNVYPDGTDIIIESRRFYIGSGEPIPLTLSVSGWFDLDEASPSLISF
jgi:hypothetical protein